MKSIITTLYFATMLFVVALLIRDLGYSYPEALFISSTYLPTIALVELLSRELKLRTRTSVVEATLAAVGAFILQILLITLANHALHRLSFEMTMPEIVVNPILVFLIFMLYWLPYKFISTKFTPRENPAERKIEFTSNRKRISIFTRELLYVESRDTEVWLHTSSGESYRSRTNISSWHRELDPDFLRIHRSYLINRSHIQTLSPEEATLNNGIKLPISRSYQQSVMEMYKNNKE